MTPAEQSELADLLARLRRDGQTQSGLDERLVPPDAPTAYAVAALVAERLGWDVGGWKIAANKPEMQQALRADAPIIGRVFSRFIHTSPATLPFAALVWPILECEYVVKLGQDLPPRAEPYTAVEVEAAISAIHIGIEVAQCRFAHDDAFPPITAVLADGSGCGGLVIGPEIADWRSADIASAKVELSVDGALRRTGTAGEAIDHPMVPTTWLANALSDAGIGLHAGEVISTGTCSNMLKAKAGMDCSAQFGPFGTVQLSFS